MFVEMNCRCDAMLQIDSDEEESVWSLVWRFTSSHVSCGYVTPGVSDDVKKTAHKLVTRPGGKRE